MKKIVSMILAMFMLLNNSFVTLANTNITTIHNSKDLEIINNVTNRIELEEGITSLKIVDYEVLYDLESNPTYIYIKYNNGYAISSRENGVISEYDLENDNTNYDKSVCQFKIYAGPLNYICQRKNTPLSVNSNDNLKTLIQKSNDFLAIENENNNLDSRATTASWTSTISSSRMQKYSSGRWINSNSNYPPSSGYPANGICGTIVAAGLLAYYDDYVDNNYVPSSIRSQLISTPGSLITTLYTYIDKGKNGTIVSDVQRGINLFLQDYSSVTYGASSSVLTFSNAKTKINASRPVCVGMLSALGAPSNYGNHWVLAYQYYDDSGTSNDKYRVVDNHGSYTATINVSWTSGLVYMVQ